MSALKWFPMADAPLDGTEIIVLINSASVPIVRSAWYRDGWQGYDEVERQEYGIEHDPDEVGWWSYRHSVTQEKLEGYDIPIAWLPMPDTAGLIN